MSELLEHISAQEEAFQSKARLASLYSDLRVQRLTNPDGYAANAAAWQRALAGATLVGAGRHYGGETPHLLVLRSGRALLQSLQTREFGVPLALGAVLQDAVSRREFIPLKEFAGSTESIYARRWTVSPWRLLSWGLRQLGVWSPDDGGERVPEASYVVVANVEKVADAVLEEVKNGASPTDLVFSRQLFADMFKNPLHGRQPLSSTDMTVLLTYLARDRRAVVFDSSTVKCASPDTAGPPLPIDKHDAAIGSLRGLISSLQTQTAVLESTISSLDAKARLALKSKNRITAMSALRSKKLAESRLQARSDVLINLGKVYSQIEAASDQVAAVRIMETSTSVLQSLHAKVGGVEGVEAVVDALADEMAKVEDVNRVVNEAGAGAEAADEVEVEEELAALEREERQAIEQADAKARTQAAELAADRAAERTQQRLAELPRVANVSIEGPEPSESSARTAAITEKIARVSLDK